MTNFQLQLSGCANNHPIRVEARGTATPAALRVQFSETEGSLAFDARLPAIAVLDAVVAHVAGMATAADEPVAFRIRADVVGEGGIDAGTFVVLAQLQRGRAGWRCTAQLAEARMALEIGERFTAVGARTVAVALQAGCAVATSSAVLGTTRGREMLVVSTAVVVGAAASTARSVGIKPTRLGRGAVVVALAKR